LTNNCKLQGISNIVHPEVYFYLFIY
jgi:hypothetical protein